MSWINIIKLFPLTRSKSYKTFQSKISLYAGIDQFEELKMVTWMIWLVEFQHRVKFYAGIFYRTGPAELFNALATSKFPLKRLWMRGIISGAVGSGGKYPNHYPMLSPTPPPSHASFLIPDGTAEDTYAFNPQVNKYSKSGCIQSFVSGLRVAIYWKTN